MAPRERSGDGTRAASGTGKDAGFEGAICQFDLIVAGDMTRQGDRAYRIAQEVRHHAGQGCLVGLLQTSRPPNGSSIAPEVQTCIRRGLGVVIDPANRPASDLLVVHAPSEVDWIENRLAGVHAQRTVLVCYGPRDYAVPGIRKHLRDSATILWAPVNSGLREAAPAKLELMPADWLPPVGTDLRSSPDRRRIRPLVGWITTRHGPADLLPSTDVVDMVMLNLSQPQMRLADSASDNDGYQLSLDRALGLDALVYFPHPDERAFPDTLVRAALQRKMAVLLDDRLRQHYGKGPIYCAPQAVEKRLARLFGKAGAAKPVERRSDAGKEPPPRGGDIRPRKPNAIAGSGCSPRPIMFVASNGVGVGHVTRLLAIARRINPQVPVVFASQAQAIGVIEHFGYLAEYVPSASYIGGDFPAWDRWFQAEMERLIDSYDPALVVYDGNNPSDGLIHAAASRRDCRLAWVRRGLWGNTTSPYLANAHWFDLVIEPGELEGQPDAGVTAGRRCEAQLVPPVRLLDAEELLSRQEAAGLLGLDAGRPSVLVQLGAGYNRDVVSLIDELVAAMRHFPQLQISIAEWVNSAHPLNYWPGVKYVRGYPLSQYFRAFDFSIAAAGYNTFHEVVGFGLPTIFIANKHPSMDDQAGRAEYAQALQAAFELPEDDLGDLRDLITLLVNPKGRDFLAGNCLRICGRNGAEEAARLLEELAWTAE